MIGYVGSGGSGNKPLAVAMVAQLCSMIYEQVTILYDEWTSKQSERGNESYTAGTSEYIWYVSVIYNVFYISKVSLK